jgi:maltose alpha-D-glucosyltransferase/alpha-amylase
MPVYHPDIMAMKEELKTVIVLDGYGSRWFQADMAGALVKNANISGNDQFFNARDEGTKQFWQEIRQLMDKEYPGSFMVAEWSGPKDALDNAFHTDFFHWFQGYNDLTQKESWRILNGYSEGHSFFDKEEKENIMKFLDSYMEQYIATKDKGFFTIPMGIMIMQELTLTDLIKNWR